MPRGDPNPYAPPFSEKAASVGAPDRRALLWRSAATIALSSVVGAPIVSAFAYALLELGLPPWTLRNEPFSRVTIDLHAGAPLVLNNVLLTVVCGVLAWPAIWRKRISLARAAVVVLAVSALAILGAIAMKVLGDLYMIGGTEAVLLYEAIAGAVIGFFLAVGFASSDR